MEDRRRLLDRLAKLIALEASPNAHEAASAARRVEKLLAKHHLTREEVLALGQDEHFELSLGDRGWGSAWRFALATAAARSCGAEAVIVARGRKRKLHLVGERADVLCAKEIYESALAALLHVERVAECELGEVLHMAVRMYGRRVAADSFRRGVTLGIIRELGREQRGGIWEEVGEAPAEVPSERASEPAPEPESRELVRSGDGREERTRRAGEACSADRRDIYLDDARVYELFEMGADLASALVRLGPDGKLHVKEPRK